MKIHITGLTKIYGRGESAVVALNNFDLSVGAGEICVVRGPNGSGKSTLISILSGKDVQSAGRIEFSNRPDANGSISVVNQFENLLDFMTIAEHCELFSAQENIPFIPQELLNRRPPEMSRGEQQIVAVALAMTSSTELLLADEPTGALGSEDSIAVYDFIQHIAREHGTSVLLVTHDELSERIADRVVRITDGRISETWKPGGSEFQVVNDSGWLKLPAMIHDRIEPHVAIAPSADGAILHAEQKPKTEQPDVVLPEFSSESAIAVNKLTCRYSGVQVLGELSLSIPRGSVFAVMGKSGSGKTTLLKSIAGLHSELSGEIAISGNEQIPYFSIDAMFGLELTPHELEISEILISQLRLTELAERPVGTFSGGQKQRLNIALALSSASSAILLDEPTSALDDEMTDVVLRAIVESGKTVVLTSHDDRVVAYSTHTLHL